jgi:hypothetical protein
MTVTKAEASLLFYKSLEGIEDVFRYVEDQTDVFNDEIAAFRWKMEEVADDMLRLAAQHDWGHAFKHGGFAEFWRDYERFTDRKFRPYFG